MTLYAKYLKTIGNPRFLPYIRVFLFVDVKFKQVALTEYWYILTRFLFRRNKESFGH